MKRMRFPKRKPEMKMIPERDRAECLMTVADWLQGVASAFFIDYDGFGELATENEVSRIYIHPSDITAYKKVIPTWATHIMWYNR